MSGVSLRTCIGASNLGPLASAITIGGSLSWERPKKERQSPAADLSANRPPKGALVRRSNTENAPDSAPNPLRNPQSPFIDKAISMHGMQRVSGSNPLGSIDQSFSPSRGFFCAYGVALWAAGFPTPSAAIPIGQHSRLALAIPGNGLAIEVVVGHIKAAICAVEHQGAIGVGAVGPALALA